MVGLTSDSEAAIRKIVTLSPDLLFIDTKMKQADAMGVCRRVLGADEQIKVAVLTSHGAQMNGAKHVRLGWRVIF